MKDETDGFLTRWSRRKADAKADDASRQERVEAEAGAGEAEARSVEAVEPEFDVSTLPSIESLTKDSDFTVFLQKGVPTPLKKAALHKMWMTDPAIRDYIGLSEMSWDFNAPEAFPGYGALSPLAKVADMVRNIATASEQQSATSEEVSSSVAHINELSQDLTSRIAEAGERIREVRSMANHLAKLVEQFREG